MGAVEGDTGAERAAGETVRVLHVDDEPGLARTAGGYLERVDPAFEVDPETDPEAALARIREEPPDAVVSDYQMPRTDGLELLRAVREEHPDLPFVLFTGKGSESVAAEAISAGVTDYLQKESGTAQYEVLANRVRNAVDQYRAERRAERMRRLFEALYHNPLMFGALLGPDGRVRHINETASEITGIPSERCEGEPFAGMPWWPADREGVPDVEGLVERAAAGETVQFRTPYVADGEERTALGAMLPVRHEGVLVLGQDVTEWERDRARLERQNERLEALATAVSHDLGSPLAAVERNLDLAGEACDSAALERAGRSLDRVRELVDDLRLLVRDGDPAETTEPVDLGALAERCWAGVDAAGGRLVVRTDLTVRADETRLARVLRNLLANAATHGGEEVTVTVGTLPDRRGFFVEDDGPGIARDRRGMVFEAGYSTDPGGTGLGLTVVRELVRAHGWTVRAAEGTDGGARFEVTGVEPA